jgi:predicted histone-like DNA-binding protein
MSVHYELVERPNPRDKKAPKKFYAQVVSSGELTMRALSKEIASRSTTVSDTDALAVLNDLTHILAERLAEGLIARLGNFGDFTISISSTGVEEEKKFTAANIHSPKILFRPGLDLQEMLKNLQYQKVARRPSNKTKPSTPPADGDDDDDEPGYMG